MIEAGEWKAIIDGLRRRPPLADAMALLRAALVRIAKRRGLKDADDLVSDVLVQLLERPDLLDRVSSPEPYLQLLLRRAQFVRARRAALDLRSRSEPAGGLWILAELRAAQNPTQASLIARVDLQRLLERAGEHLTEDDLELLQLRFWDGHDLRTIAQHLGITYNYAAVRVFRLLRKLRACMSIQG
jgi:RNA polymerase sigma factor (sigma-70 family)